MARRHGVIAMDDTMMRQLVAAEVANQHGSEGFIRQLTSGEPDDGAYMMGARVVRDWFASQLAPAPEVIDE